MGARVFFLNKHLCFEYLMNKTCFGYSTSCSYFSGLSRQHIPLHHCSASVAFTPAPTPTPIPTPAALTPTPTPTPATPLPAPTLDPMPVLMLRPNLDACRISVVAASVAWCNGLELMLLQAMLKISNAAKVFILSAHLSNY